MSVKVNKNTLPFALPAYGILVLGLILFGRNFVGRSAMAIGFLYLTAVTTVICFEVNFTKEKYKDIALYAFAVVCILTWLPLALTRYVAYDQGYTVGMVRHTMKEMVELCSYDVHSPLYYFIAAAFYNLFGKSIVGLKLCSVFFTALYYLMLLFPFKKEFGRKITVYALLVSWLYPAITMHAAEPRMYTMAFAAFSWLCFIAYRLMKNYKTTDAAAFFFVSVFCVYIHTFTMLTTVVLYLFMAGFIIFGKHKDKKKMLIFFPINAFLVSVSFVPWLRILFRQFKEKGASGGALSNPKDLIWEIVTENFSANMTPSTWKNILGLCIFAAMLSVIIYKKSKYIKEILIFLGIFSITAGIGIVLATFVTPCFMGRYVTCASFAVISVIALGLSLIKNKKAAIIILMTFLMSGLFVYKDEFVLQHDTKGIEQYNSYIAANLDEDDAIMYSGIHPNFLSIYNPDIYTYIYGYCDPFNPFSNDEVYRELNQLDKIKGDLYFVCFSNRDISEYMNCDSELIMDFHFMYFDFKLYKVWNIH